MEAGPSSLVLAPEVDISKHPSGIVPQLQNMVATVNLGCKLDLKQIALHARNSEYNPKASTPSNVDFSGVEFFELEWLRADDFPTAFRCRNYEDPRAQDYSTGLRVRQNGRPLTATTG